MSTPGTYIKITYIGCLLIFLSLHGIAQDSEKPTGKGSKEAPFQITKPNHLYWMSQTTSSWDKHFVQTEDIDASPTKEWSNGKGFSPIGDTIINFNGNYNGKGHVIDKLYINRPSQHGVGLFGNISGSQARVESLGVTNLNITGKMKVAGLVGEVKDAVITKCFTTGIVTDSSCAGGLVGENLSAEISDCYSKVNVNTKTGAAGGFVGINAGDISNCYSTGKVSGAYDIGGFAGQENNEGTINGCFWDTESSGVVLGSGGTGLAPKEMRKNRTYLKEGWDFVFETTNGTDDIWSRYRGINEGYPLLSWQSPFPVKSSLPDIIGEGAVDISDYPTALDIDGDTITAKTDDPLKYTEEGTYNVTWIYKSASNKVTKQNQQIIVKVPSKTKPVSDVSVFVYPNPLGNRLHIESGRQGIDKITISDRFGDTKIEKKNLKSNEVIDVSSLETGLYTVSIETNKEHFSWKVFKK
jgi:hypothetical protein